MTKHHAAQAALIDHLLADSKKPEDLIGENGILKHLTKAIVERARQAELATHLLHYKQGVVAYQSGNSGTVATSKRSMVILVPCRSTFPLTMSAASSHS